MRREDKIAAVLFVIAILPVLIPFYIFVFTFPAPMPIRLFWPLGDPVVFGGLLILGGVILFILGYLQLLRFYDYWELNRFSYFTKIRNVKLAVISIMLGIPLLVFALADITLDLTNLLSLSLALFLIGFLGFVLIPPQYLRRVRT